MDSSRPPMGLACPGVWASYLRCAPACNGPFETLEPRPVSAWLWQVKKGHLMLWNVDLAFGIHLHWIHYEWAERSQPCCLLSGHIGSCPILGVAGHYMERTWYCVLPPLLTRLARSITRLRADKALRINLPQSNVVSALGSEITTSRFRTQPSGSRPSRLARQHHFTANDLWNNLSAARTAHRRQRGCGGLDRQGATIPPVPDLDTWGSYRQAAPKPAAAQNGITGSVSVQTFPPAASVV